MPIFNADHIPQGHRFDVLEDIGCWPHTYNTWGAYVFVFIPPILSGLVSAVYGIRSVISLNKSRTQFNELLSHHSKLSSSRYVRLMWLAGVQSVCAVPIGCYLLYCNAQGNLFHPRESVHWRSSRVDNVPAVVWRSDPITSGSVEFTRWLCVVYAIIFFAFFGFDDVARKYYRAAMQSIKKHVGATGTIAHTGSSG